MDLKKYVGISIILFFALFVVGIQIWTTVNNTSQIERTVAELKNIQDKQLLNEKSRQEIISLRIKNEMDSLFWSRLLGILGPMIMGFVALLGALMGLRNYLDSREKERLDRAATDLQRMLEQIANKEPRVRAMGVVGLQHFFVKDKEEYHLRALSALTTTARLEDDAEVLRCIRIAVERAVDELPSSVVKQVSWQHVNLRGADLAGHDMSALDLRDADLENVNLSGADLTGTLLMNARMNGAILDNAKMTRTNCEYADFAGASLQRTELPEARLYHAKVQEMNLAGANLRQAIYNIDEVAWEKIKNWRKAVFDDGVLDSLLERLGPEPSGVRILMLMWEIPPFVAGGTWTACYHMIRNLRRHGANITVVVPWDANAILPVPFGCEVKIVSLGINFAGSSVPPTQQAWWSEYSSTSVYGNAYAYSPYSPGAFGYGKPYSPYSPSAFTYRQPYSPYNSSQYGSGSFSPYRASVEHPPHQALVRSSILYLSEAFKKRLEKFAEFEDFDIIHAQDWITFSAAKAIAKKLNKPWIAHFHSTEIERRYKNHDIVIQHIEQEAVREADHLMTPSLITARVLQNNYGASEAKVTVAPNVLSEEEMTYTDAGSFETRRIIFLGRFAEQKGPDLFAAIAQNMRQSGNYAEFWAFGEGDIEASSQLLNGGVSLKGFLPWEQRGAAFRGATAIIVPSRAEPFGMVVLEAMQHGVPVFYPSYAGVAEVLESGIKINPHDAAAVATQVIDLISHWEKWATMVKAQSAEIANYGFRQYEKKLIVEWNRLSGGKQIT